MASDHEALRASVRESYSAAAAEPAGKHPFPVGAAFAASGGYEVDDLPAAAVDAFAGVSNVSMTAPIAEGMTVVNLGCGAGLDSVIATASVDLLLVNGIFNLNPVREQIFAEFARILRPGGHVAGAELILGETLPEVLQSRDANRFS